MEQQHKDVSAPINGQPRRIGWAVVPLLLFAGLLSTVAAFRTIVMADLNTGSENLFRTELLGGLSMGLIFVTVLMFYNRIRSWRSAILLVVITVAAHCPPLFYRYVPSFFNQDADLPLLGRTLLADCVFFLPASLIAFIGFSLVLLPARKASRTVPVSIIFSLLANLVFLYVIDRQRGAWISFFNAEPFWPLWQLTLAFFLGMTLRIGQLAVSSASFATGPSRVRLFPYRNSFIALGILVAYLIGLSLWTGGVMAKQAEKNQQEQARVKAELAQSLANPPSRENLPPVEQRPMGEMLLMKGVGSWSVFGSHTQLLPAETELPAYERGITPRALRPERYQATAAYSTSGSTRVVVTTFPTADWAQYELRHASGTNQMILHPDWVKKLTKFGNSFYQEGAYIFWPSNNHLVMIDCQGINQSVIDEFLKAYLAKYPSSL